MHTILVIRLYFPLYALHVSDYISPSSGATFISCTSHLVYADTSGCCVATATQHLVSLYTYCKTIHGAYKVKVVNLTYHLRNIKMPK